LSRSPSSFCVDPDSVLASTGLRQKRRLAVERAKAKPAELGGVRGWSRVPCPQGSMSICVSARLVDQSAKTLRLC
jgi:hypothetical protein